MEGATHGARERGGRACRLVSSARLSANSMLAGRAGGAGWSQASQFADRSSRACGGGLPGWVVGIERARALLAAALIADIACSVRL